LDEVWFAPVQNPVFLGAHRFLSQRIHALRLPDLLIEPIEVIEIHTKRRGETGRIFSSTGEPKRPTRMTMSFEPAFGRIDMLVNIGRWGSAEPLTICCLHTG